MAVIDGLNVSQVLIGEAGLVGPLVPVGTVLTYAPEEAPVARVVIDATRAFVGLAITTSGGDGDGGGGPVVPVVPVVPTTGQTWPRGRW